MIKIVKQIYRYSFKTPVLKIKQIANKSGKNRKCYVCQNTFNHFGKFRGGSKNIPVFRKELRMVGSDADNFRCIYCGSHDRERHLFMFFDKLELWQKMKNSKVLHFAPEKHLSVKIAEQAPLEYVKADLFSKKDDVVEIDATEITFPDNRFDFVICNHVLEHIPDYLKALKEIYRVLRPGGIAILQTPYSILLKNNFEDENINTDNLRLIFHGQEDHVRTFSERQFFKSLEEVGFHLQIAKHSDLFNDQISYYYGVNKKEDLIKVIKPPAVKS